MTLKLHCLGSLFRFSYLEVQKEEPGIRQKSSFKICFFLYGHYSLTSVEMGGTEFCIW